MLAATGNSEIRQGIGARPLGACKAPRRDTVIATAVLALLIAGWLMNVVEIKRFASGLGGLLQQGQQGQRPHA